MKTKPLTLETFAEIRKRGIPFVVSHEAMLHISCDSSFQSALDISPNTDEASAAVLLGNALVIDPTIPYSSKTLCVSVGDKTFELTATLFSGLVEVARNSIRRDF